MTKLHNKQLQQVDNIFQTLIEASEHFQKLIKEKELTQSIFIFSSIVEGFGAIDSNLTTSHNEEWGKNKSKIENHLLQIAQLLEQGNLLKINEILQFSLIPNFKKLRKEITNSLDDNMEDKVYTIGVFASFHNPRLFYPEPRINALVHESEKQNAKLLFFTSNDVNFAKKKVTADVCTNGKWERVTTDFPDVINNVGTGKRSIVERKLRRLLPFTSFHVGNKYTLPKRIVKYKKFAELLVPFRVCRNISDIHAFIDQNNKVVFKYLLSNRGENIFFVTKKGTRYQISEHKKERILNQDAFNNWLETVVLREKGSFIIQRYIHTRTKEDEPYHFRAHVQKNGDGKWVLTHIYPRVGSKKSNLSNVATDGRVEDFHTFLMREFGELGKKYEKDILRLSIEVAIHLDKLYGMSLDELGLDFAIDENGKYWMHEANNGPQTAYHEEKRAVNTIAYAKYIAKNGIYHSESWKKARTNMFQAHTTNLEFAELDNRLTLGVLIGKITSDPLALACVETAKQKNMNLFCFTPKDIDFDDMLIRGYFYENEEWVPKVVEYPDVIFDRFKLRGDENVQWIYDELEEIPFTNEWENRLHTRSEVYQKLQGAESFMTAFQQVTKTRDIFRYLETYNKVVLKPEIGNEPAAKILSIELLSNGKYLVTQGLHTKEYNKLPLLNKLKEMIKETNFIVQQDASSFDKAGNPFYIHTHVMLNGEEQWDFVSCYADRNISGANSDNRKHLRDFIQENLLNKDNSDFEKMIKETSLQAATTLQEVYQDKVTEVAMILTIDKYNHINIMEANPNGPVLIYDAKKHAECVVTCAKYVESQNNNI